MSSGYTLLHTIESWGLEEDKELSEILKELGIKY
jgi:hypothetical protein